MKTRSTLILAISLIFAGPALANDEHHPEKAAAAKGAPAAPAAPAATVTPPATVKKMQDNVRKMQAQLDRASQAKTEGERRQAMDEHMRTMAENMRLAGGAPSAMMDCADMHGGMMGSLPAAPAK